MNCFKEKAPLKVAIELNIKQIEATKYYGEYSNSKRLHKLYSAYTELGDEGVRDFLRLYRRAKKERIGVEQIVKLIRLADKNEILDYHSLEKACK